MRFQGGTVILNTEAFDIAKLKEQRINPRFVSADKVPKIKSIPPMRTIPIAMQMELMNDMPDSIIEVLSSHKPRNKLKKYGLPLKTILSSENINDLCFISSYLISENFNINKNHLELFITYKQMFFWSLAMVFKPNNPYFAVISAEENSIAGLTFASYIASYYLHLSEKYSNEMLFKWYRSLEFAEYRKPIDEPGVVIIQCRWPSWVDNKEKLLRCIVNVRAAYENASLILIMNEEDLSIVPQLLRDEPFGVFFKLGNRIDIMDTIDEHYKSSPINNILTRIKGNLK